MAVSQNGWPVNPARSSRTVPGTGIRLVVADGPAGDVLLWVASQFDQRVEDIDTAAGGVLDDWGWADRPIRGSAETSNHASATAIDLNATRHPLGKQGTFTAAQAGEIRRIVAETGSVVRWGGDYTGRVDEMHFEINANYQRVAEVAATLGQEEISMSAEANIVGFLWTGGQSTRTESPDPTSVHGKLDALGSRLANLEGFVFRGGPSTEDGAAEGTSDSAVIGRLKQTETELATIRSVLGEILGALKGPGAQR